jgi:hypothetical protein
MRSILDLEGYSGVRGPGPEGIAETDDGAAGSRVKRIRVFYRREKYSGWQRFWYLADIVKSGEIICSSSLS